jgi:hypothetical protein
MVCPRHYTLRTKSGHVIKFEPGVPRDVPDIVVHEALAVNILPVSGALDDTESDHTNHMTRTTIAGPLRDALALRVIADLARENDSSHFDGGGRPKTNIINERSGLALTAKERVDYWDKYRNLNADGEELPTHKALDAVLEIQYLTTPKDTRDYAVAVGVPDKAIVGRSVREQKEILLAAVLKAA